VSNSSSSHEILLTIHTGISANVVPTSHMLANKSTKSAPRFHNEPTTFFANQTTLLSASANDVGS
jgi:hypothetical protein